MAEKYPIDDLWKMLLADESWESDPAVMMGIVQGMHITYVGCPLEV